MYKIVLANISELSDQSLPAVVRKQAPEGPHRQSWLAGRILLSQIFLPFSMPELVYGQNGKPYFPNNLSLWFNISHSGNKIALLISDEGEVGCDIEIIRPRKNWLLLANRVFSSGEQKELKMEPENKKLSAFWRIWTRKEALIKQCGGSISQVINVDSTLPGKFFLSHCQLNELSLAVCTSTPFSLDLLQI